MSLDRFRAFARTQAGRAYRPTAAPVGPRAAQDATPTAPTPKVTPRTQPIPLPAVYPGALPAELETMAEGMTLVAQGRLSVRTLVVAFQMRDNLWSREAPPMAAVEAAMAYLRAWESFYAPLMEGDCPQGMRCPQTGGLCSWHRKTLRRWFDRLHPVVRAAADPATFAERVAPLVTDLPTETTRST